MTTYTLVAHKNAPSEDSCDYEVNAELEPGELVKMVANYLARNKLKSRYEYDWELMIFLDSPYEFVDSVKAQAEGMARTMADEVKAKREKEAEKQREEAKKVVRAQQMKEYERLQRLLFNDVNDVKGETKE